MEIEPDLRENLKKTIDDTVAEIYISQEFNYLRWDTLNKQVSVGPYPLDYYEKETGSVYSRYISGIIIQLLFHNIIINLIALLFHIPYCKSI